jgi:hypothetical protein
VPGVVVRHLFRQPPRDGVEIALRLRNRRGRLQPSDDVQVVPSDRAQLVRYIDRHPRIR